MNEIYVNICEFLRDTKQYRVASRWECVHYCVGYYGSVGPEHLSAIDALYKNGMISK